MDRESRFSHFNSHYYEASPRSTPSTDRRARASTTRGTSKPIDLDELYDWTRQKERVKQQQRDTGDLSDWHHRTASNETKEDSWPAFSLNFNVDRNESAPRYTETPDPEQHYNTNFLHPPSPGQTNFFGQTQQADATSDKPPLRRRSTKLSAVIDLEKSSRFGWWTVILLLLTVLVVTLTAMYANGSVKSLMQDKFFTSSSSNAILILRVMTEICALLLAALVLVVVEDLQWALASRPEGVSLLHFVGLDAGTGVWGLVRLLATADWKEKYSSLFRLLVICTIPLPGIVLMGDISVELVFFPQYEYPVAAGVAEFNSSFISAVDETSLTALLVSMGSASWSGRDTWSLDPLGSNYGECTISSNDTSWTPCAESHLLTGGVLGITPQSDDLTTFPRSTAYVVPKTRTMQLEYGDVHDIEALYNKGACYTIGTTYAAAYWCTQTGPRKELLFGSSYCPIAVQAKGECLSDESWTSPLQISTSLFVYKRYATVSYDRSNFSVLSVTDLSPPERQIVGLDDYLTSISAIVPGFKPMNDSSTTANITKGDNSALAVYAVSALPLNDNQVAKKMSLAAVRKAMSVPFNYFHANYFSSESLFEVTAPRTGLSADMYTNMSLAIESHQVVAGKFSRWAFGLLCGILMALSAVMIVTTARICGRRPQRCGYPTLDFAAVCAAKGGIPRPPSSTGSDDGRRPGGGNGLHRSLTALGQKPGPFQVASRIKGEKVMLG